MRSNITLRPTLLVIALSIAGLSGCQSGGSSADVSTAGTPVASSVSSASGAAAWIPAVQDLRASVQMTDAQASQIDSALTQWRSAVESRREAMRSGEAPLEAGAARTAPPAALFLAASGKVLQTDQFIALVGYLKQRQTGLKSQMQAARPQFQGNATDRIVRRMVDQLALNPDQEKQVRENLQALWATRKDALAGGQTPTQPDSAQFTRSREQFVASLSKVLTPDQLARFDSLRAKREEKWAAGKDKRQAAGVDNAVGCLQGILQLSESQATQIRQVLAGLSASAPSGTAVGAAMGRFGHTMFPGAHLLMSAQSQIRPILSPDQVRRLDAVLQLLPDRVAHS